MAYFVKYRIRFKDEHNATPANWRIDIMPKDGTVIATPITLRPAANPLTLEYPNSDESKRSWIMGRNATIRYVYTGADGEPLPEEFFDTDERFHRVEIYKNEVLDGVYYVKPDNGQYDYRYPPFEITLTAVDGLAYSKSVNYNMYDAGLLKYGRITLYEAIVYRALQQVIDATVPVNVINSLMPSNAAIGTRLLNGTYLHTDIYYDFEKGPTSVYEALESFCKTFYSRMMVVRNQIWIIRSSDLYEDQVSADQYTSDSAVTTIDLPGFVNQIGPKVGMYDGVAVKFNATIRLVPAIKKAVFNVTYKSINRIANFAWLGWNGTDYPGWTRFNDNIRIGNAGTASIEDPYRLVVYRDPAPPTFTRIAQNTAPIIDKHDLAEFSFRYKFNGCTSFSVAVLAFDNDVPGLVFWLSSSGDWVSAALEEPTYIEIQRSGKKRSGSYSVKASPISRNKDSSFFSQPLNLQVAVHVPVGKWNEAGPNYNPALGPSDDGVADPNIEVWPMKLGVISTGSKGRTLTVTNKADYSYIQDDETFTFIDTGEEGLSNTLFVADNVVETWHSSKDGVTSKDVEEHMARANVDQYAKSLRTFESSIYSNTIELYNLVEVDKMPGKRFMILRDKYDVKKCIHDILVEEVLPEQGADVNYVETDVEDEE